ncbi:MAG: hypothetical protein AAFV53_21525 [Myxococcota bacterium]
MRLFIALPALLVGCEPAPVDFGDSLPGWAHPDDAVATVADTLVPFGTDIADLAGPPSTTYGKTPEIVVKAVGTDLYVLAHDYAFDPENPSFASPRGAKLLRLERTIDDYIITQVIDPPSFLDRILGFDRGEDGALYVASAAVEFDVVDATFPANDQYREGVVHVTRLSPAGALEMVVDLDVARAARAESEQVINPMTASTGRLAVGGGTIALVHGINTTPDPAIDNRRHQKALTTFIDDETGDVSRLSTIWVSHSFDQRLFWDGTAFVEHHLGDAYPRHIAFARTNPNVDEGAREYPLLYIKGETGENTTRTSIGNVVALPDSDDAAFLAVYATEPTSGTQPIGNGFNNTAGSREIAITRLKRNFEVMDLSKEMHLDESLPDTLEIVGGQTPLKWLTNYHETSQGTLNGDRPRIVDLGGDQFAVLWEQWHLNDAQTFEGTWGMVINSRGQTLVDAREITQNHIPRGDDMVALPGQAAWVSGDPIRTALIVHTVDAELNYRTFLVE